MNKFTDCSKRVSKNVVEACRVTLPLCLFASLPLNKQK